MLNTKTILLSGIEQKIKISGRNCDIRNDSADIVYASNEAGLVSGADGALSIPAGQAADLRGTAGTVYLLGTGNVTLAGHDDTEMVFKCAPAGGGGGTVDTEARNAITTLSATVVQNAEQFNRHAEDNSIHLSAKDVAEMVSNPNILINGDFSINQRGKTSYSGGNIYTVDGWKINGSDSTITLAEDGIVFSNSNTSGQNAILTQVVEYPSKFIGKTLTFSLSCTCTDDIV